MPGPETLAIEMHHGGAHGIDRTGPAAISCMSGVADFSAGRSDSAPSREEFQ